MYDRETGMLNLIDFGAVHEYSSNFIDLYIQIIKAAMEKDKKKILDLSIEMGFLNGTENDICNEAHAKSILLAGSPFAEEGEFDFGNTDLVKETYE
jgi:aarF domain-containing kinase